MTKGGKIAIGVVLTAAAIGGLMLFSGTASASSGGGGGGGGSGGGGGGGGTDPTKPGGTKKPKKPTKPKPDPKPTKPKGRGSGTLRGQQDYPPGGLIWGTPFGDYTVVGDPAFGDNFIMIGKDCTWVIEGPGFRPPNADIAIEADTLEQTLMLEDGTNTAWGFVDSLEGRGFDAKATVLEIATEVSPLCGSVGPDQWGDGGVSGGMYGWFEDFMEAIDNWRAGIEFGGEEDIA